MKDLWQVKAVIVLIACLKFCSVSPAQELGCVEISRMAAMARAKTMAALRAAKEKAGESYRVQLVFAARALEIDPRNKVAAETFLDLKPREGDDAEEEAWFDLTQLEQCKAGGISESDLKVLDILQYHLPRLAARAVLLAPGKMFVYISYAQFALSPESDYAVQMRKVCLARHREFVEAVNHFSPKDRSWFVSKVFNPDGCRTLAFPEQ